MYFKLVKVAELVGCEVDKENIDSTIECLQDKESADSVENEFSVQDYTVSFYPFVVTVDEYFLPDSPMSMMVSSVIDSTIPLLLETNANEGFWSLMYYLTDLMPNRELEESERELTHEKYNEYVQNIFSLYPVQV